MEKALQIQGMLDKDFLEFSLPCGFIVTGDPPKFPLYWANSVFISLLGYRDFDELFEALGGNSISFIAPEDVVYVAQQSKIREQQGSFNLFDIDYRIMRKDHSRLWIRQRSRHRILPDGTSVVYATYTDISRQKNLEREYHSRIAYQQTLSNKALWHYRFDITDNKFIDIYPHNEENDRYLKSYTPDRLFQEFVPDLKEVSGSSMPFSLINCAKLQEYYQNGQVNLHLIYYSRRENLYVTMDIILSPNPVNGHLEAFMICNDVTMAYMKDIASRSIINEKYELICFHDSKEDQIIFFSKGNPSSFKGTWDEALPYLKKAHVASLLHQEIPSQGESCPMNGENIHKLLSKRKSLEFPSQWKDDNGKKRIQHISMSYSDKVLGTILLTASDITEEKAKEDLQQRKLERALTAAETANQAKSRFLANMNHDIRTPMNAIINITNFAFEDMDDHKALTQDMEMIKASGTFLLSLINDILDMSKIESGKMKLSPSVCTLDDFTASINSVFLPLCEEKGITLHWIIDKGLPTIFIDKTRLFQMCANIMSNSVKYTDRGGTIDFTIRKGQEKDGVFACTIVIRDTGKGMSKKFLKRMFIPFEREHDGDTHTGTGLGLSITKSIVTEMGGTIQIESEEGVGTCVTVNLPLPLTTENQIRECDKSHTEWNQERRQGTKKRILIAEDHQLNREIIARIVQSLGYETSYVENGKEALDLFASSPLHHFSTILMDIRMPVMVVWYNIF